MKVGIFAKSVLDPKHRDALVNLLSVLIKRDHEIWCPPSLEDFVRMNFSNIAPQVFDSFNLKYSPIDVLCSVGGDGTILST